MTRGNFRYSVQLFLIFLPPGGGREEELYNTRSEPAPEAAGDLASQIAITPASLTARRSLFSLCPRVRLRINGEKLCAATTGGALCSLVRKPHPQREHERQPPSR